MRNRFTDIRVPNSSPSSGTYLSHTQLLPRSALLLSLYLSRFCAECMCQIRRWTQRQSKASGSTELLPWAMILRRCSLESRVPRPICFPIFRATARHASSSCILYAVLLVPAIRVSALGKLVHETCLLPVIRTGKCAPSPLLDLTHTVRVVPLVRIKL